jgi:serine/threonine protein kinase
MLSAEEPGIKNLDFGISKLAVEERDTRLTASSHILGTPESMAPEQVLTPTDITDRCDVYLLGLLLYRMVAARSPYGAESANQFLMAHSFEAPHATHLRGTGRERLPRGGRARVPREGTFGAPRDGRRRSLARARAR